MFSFLRKRQTSSKVAVLFYIYPSVMHQSSKFFVNSYYCRFLKIFIYSSRCALVYHHSFNLHFPNNYWCWVSFHVFFRHSCILFVELTFSHLGRVMVFLLLSLNSLYIFWITSTLYQMYELQIFSPNVWLPLLIF